MQAPEGRTPLSTPGHDSGTLFTTTELSFCWIIPKSDMPDMASEVFTNVAVQIPAFPKPRLNVVLLMSSAEMYCGAVGTLDTTTLVAATCFGLNVDVAMMLAVPGPTGVTTPDELTVATAALVEFQVTVCGALPV